jgi:UDP-4-amino-4,6-dideoxy-N-acetyl-beta-L-altrosamine N-acetyltransferase
MELRLRGIRSEDLDMIMGWRAEPAVADFMYTDFEPSIEHQRQWFEAICRDRTRMDWVIWLDGAAVGLLSIVRLDAVNQRCEWAFYLASLDLRGKGVGRALELNVLRYVFEELGMNKLCCEVLASNQKVVQLHERLGSVVEGRRREHVRKRGAFLDVIEMGILRADWEREVRQVHAYERAVFEAPTKLDPLGPSSD